jgi:hypothetical protein
LIEKIRGVQKRLELSQQQLEYNNLVSNTGTAWPRPYNDRFIDQTTTDDNNAMNVLVIGGIIVVLYMIM